MIIDQQKQKIETNCLGECLHMGMACTWDDKSRVVCDLGYWMRSGE